MSNIVRLGISTCPNDTFTFHALLNGLVDQRGLEFRVELLDIQELNDRLFRSEFDVAKCSFHAALLLSESMVVLPSGSALGFGVGPLLLSMTDGSLPQHADQLTLCPGQHTTATLLFQLFYPQSTRIEQVIFSEIMPRLSQGTADFGVCIHEGRFTWRDKGLGMVEDLGVRWERETNCPLPLGGLVGQKFLGEDRLRTVQQVVRDSLNYALENPDDALASMRRYAQEFDDEVLMEHVRLYVNDWTVELGATGAAALDTLNVKAREAGIIPEGSPGIKVLNA